MKPCTICHKPQPLSQFHRKATAKDGHRAQCKTCVRRYQERRALGVSTPRKLGRSPESLERRKLYHRQYMRKYNKTAAWKMAHRKCLIHKKYGITWDQYQSLITAQNNLCAICNKGESPKRRLAIDHCHRTGRVRGLLCIKCNRALGYFGDDPAVVRAALGYLLR